MAQMRVEADSARRAKTERKPVRNKKQQLKHAMTVQSAHMITTDYVALSQLGTLSEGLLLNDRTERKLKLIHSLGELMPMHQYTTEYGNTVERPSKYKAVLAGEIEIDVESDEIDFDAEMGKLALGASAGSGSAVKSATVPLSMKMSSYAAFAAGPNGALAAAQANGGGGGGSSGHADGAHANAVAAGTMSEEEAAERMQEEEALHRIASLVERVQDMQGWFDGVRAEAERERSLREQTSARLSLMQERVELLYNQMAELQWENKQLKQRLADVGAAVDDGQTSADGSVAGSIAPPSVAGSNAPSLARSGGSRGIGGSLLHTPSGRSMQGFSSKDVVASDKGPALHQHLSSIRGGLPGRN